MPLTGEWWGLTARFGRLRVDPLVGRAWEHQSWRRGSGKRAFRERWITGAARRPGSRVLRRRIQSYGPIAAPVTTTAAFAARYVPSPKKCMYLKPPPA